MALTIASHHERYHDPTSRQWSCAPCEQSFSFEKDLRRHRKTRKHRSRSSEERASPDERIYCPVETCLFHEKGISRRDNFNRHIKTKHPDYHAE